MGPLEELLFLGTLMALGAFSIDVMLPALRATAHRYGTSPTAAQLVVGLYFLGFALGQLLWGPLMDALGRRKVLRGRFLASASRPWLPWPPRAFPPPRGPVRPGLLRRKLPHRRHRQHPRPLPR